MPRIDAPTVVEHHAKVKARLVDAAEELLRAGEPLTAQAVSDAAGIARNSIYRYVDAVADLRGLVIERYLPAWLDAVATELADAGDPESRIVRWVTANLDQAASSGHGWLMAIVPAGAADEVDAAHAGMRDVLDQSWRELLEEDPSRAAAASAVTAGILEGGFRQLASGSEVDLVVEVARTATDAVVRAVTGTRGSVLG
ncbi:MAG: TetR/AcrR family transcriptional regulator [Propionicimonas sp.]|uniref:TetR/AcrR family transcriptional regulator n=1 Tax=Propionicimonas sp. TaxID=1955623 RepID=UPI003D0AB210